MPTQIIRYRVADQEKAEENVRLAQEVFAELARERPGGITYQSYRLDDGLTFVHVVTTDDLQALLRFEAFLAFTRTLGQRLDGTPHREEATPVGFYDGHLRS
ncbi:hypothetical protein [Herbidospora cretacea]|uniref:hypothetical protein n=1 Tax=Herbidospora cretacea TaxID=28444 RepID=UPI0007746ACF|nr:hypothetical protein [Herbidospora cretacea]